MVCDSVYWGDTLTPLGGVQDGRKGGVLASSGSKGEVMGLLGGLCSQAVPEDHPTPCQFRLTGAGVILTG